MTEEYLPCGVAYEEILDQVTDHRPPRDPGHQATCPNCRATLAELTDVWTAVDDLAAEPVHAPRSLLATVMDRIRELAEQPWHAVINTPDGDTRIAARVVGAIARLAAEGVPQVSLALGGGRTGIQRSRTQLAGAPGHAATDIGVSGTHVVVDVQVVVEIGAPIHQVADQIRQRIRQHIADQTELTVAEINITIVDVLNHN